MIEKKWNDGWRFWDDKNAFSMTWDVPRDAELIELPHDAMLLKAPGPDSPGGRDAAFRFGGSFVYCKTLFAPEDWKDRTAALRLEGVYHDAAVYVNRQLAARCANGYSVFHVPLDSFLRYGEDNEIRVLVRTADMPNSRWYSGSGIYRDVYLLLGGLLHIEGFGPKVSTIELGADAVILVETPVTNRGSIYVSYELETELMDFGGICRARERTRLFLAGGDSETVSQRIILPSPRLWSERDPALYTVRATLYAGDGISDKAESRFGVRTLALDAKHGLRVNGEPVKLRGACIHHDSGVLGAATYADAIDAIMSDVRAQAGPADGNVNDFMTAMDANMDAIVTHPIVSRNLEKAAAGMDLIGYNYMTARYAADAADYPNRVIVGSETDPPEIARN